MRYRLRLAYLLTEETRPSLADEGSVRLLLLIAEIQGILAGAEAVLTSEDVIERPDPPVPGERVLKLVGMEDKIK